MLYTKTELENLTDADLRIILGFLSARRDGSRGELIERVIGLQTLVTPWALDELREMVP